MRTAITIRCKYLILVSIYFLISQIFCHQIKILCMIHVMILENCILFKKKKLFHFIAYKWKINYICTSLKYICLGLGKMKNNICTSLKYIWLCKMKNNICTSLKYIWLGKMKNNICTSLKYLWLGKMKNNICTSLKYLWLGKWLFITSWSSTRRSLL